MRVKAIGSEFGKYVGYYNLVRRKPGDVFDLIKENHFSKKWMEKVGEETPRTNAPGEPTPEEVQELMGRTAPEPDPVPTTIKEAQQKKPRDNPNWLKNKK